jgi:hypothetical protein
VLDKKDAQWWLLEVQKRPDSAPDLIRALADRLAFLDKQNEQLRAELIALQREMQGSSPEVAALQARIRELEAALREGAAERHVILYSADSIVLNAPLHEATAYMPARPYPPQVALLTARPAAELLIITAEARLFALTLSALPTPALGSHALLGNPRDVAAILDRAAFAQQRFLTLYTQRGYLYSLLAGMINSAATKHERLIRNLPTDDPIIGALPSSNADLFVLTNKGRWTRFPERSLSGTGSLALPLGEAEHLIGVVSLPADAELCFISKDGRAFIRSTTEMPAKRTHGTLGGTLLRGRHLCGVTTAREILALSTTGRLIHTDWEQLGSAAHGENGALLSPMAHGEQITALIGTA